MTVSDWLTLLAIVLGPLFGVWLARHLQDRIFSRERRMDIFRMLMRTRRTRLYPEHVGALNLVEIEFAHDRQVIDAWRELFRHLGSEHLLRPDEKAPEGAGAEEVGDRNWRYDARVGDERQRLLAKLLHAMAKVLGFKIEQLEIFEGGYTPQGWTDIELEQTAIRRFAAQIAFGQRALPVLVFEPTASQAGDAELKPDKQSEAA